MGKELETCQPSGNQVYCQIAYQQFRRACQVLRAGNFEYGIPLVQTCCRLDPARLAYRQLLRRVVQKAHQTHSNAVDCTWFALQKRKLRLMAARHESDHHTVLEVGEEILVSKPRNLAVQLVMADAAKSLGLKAVALWLAEQAWRFQRHDPRVMRVLAKLYEHYGKFEQAAQLWKLASLAKPASGEASALARDMAAEETIARGGYERAIGLVPLMEPTTQPQPVPVLARVPLKSGGGLDRYSQEVAVFQAHIDNAPGDAGRYVPLAALFRRLGRIEEARAVLEQGLEATKSDRRLRLEVEDLDIEPLRQEWKRLDAAFRDKPTNQARTAHLERMQDEINKRELRLWQHHVEHNPAEPTNRFEFGIRLQRAGRIEEAILQFQEARSDPRRQVEAMFRLGQCFQECGVTELARRNFLAALGAISAHQEELRKAILFHIARGAAEAGDWLKAVEWGAELAHLDYTYREIGRLLERWEKQVGASGHRPHRGQPANERRSRALTSA